jgi:hypothetical protein
VATESSHHFIHHVNGEAWSIDNITIEYQDLLLLLFMLK